MSCGHSTTCCPFDSRPMPSAGTNDAVSASASPMSPNAITKETVQRAEDKACPSTSESDVDHRKRALQEYCDNVPCKVLEVFHIDDSRLSMYKELQKDYDRKLSWARSMGIDPLAEDFDPTTPAPPELSSWLYLFHSYLQLEELYLETMEWLNCEGHRLIDRPRGGRSFSEEVQEWWSVLTEGFTMDCSRPGSRASWHKRF